MHDEKMYRAVAADAVGPKAVASAGGAVPSQVAGGEAKVEVPGGAGGEEEGAGQAGVGMAASGLSGGAEGVSGQIGDFAAMGRGGGVAFGVTRRDFELVEEEMAAVEAADIVTLRIDPQKVAAIVLAILGRDSAPGRREVFERFAGQGNYDRTLLERVPRYSRAVWYVRRQQQLVAAVESGAVVSEEERLSAFERRARMIAELDYQGYGLPDITDRLVYLRKGSGHQDLINDLQTLVELYEREDVRAWLVKSPKYRPDEVPEALRQAGLFLQSLGMTEGGEERRLTEQLQRAVTLMVRGYEKHSVVGKFLFREVEDVGVTYPSLYVAVRNPRRKQRAEEPTGGTGGEAPEGETGGDEQVDP